MFDRVFQFLTATRNETIRWANDGNWISGCHLARSFLGWSAAYENSLEFDEFTRAGTTVHQTTSNHFYIEPKAPAHDRSPTSVDETTGGDGGYT